MSFEATVRKTESPEVALREAKARSYEGARLRLGNARKALHAAIAEYERAVAEVEWTLTEVKRLGEEVS